MNLTADVRDALERAQKRLDDPIDEDYQAEAIHARADLRILSGALAAMAEGEGEEATAEFDMAGNLRLTAHEAAKRARQHVVNESPPDLARRWAEVAKLALEGLATIPPEPPQSLSDAERETWHSDLEAAQVEAGVERREASSHREMLEKLRDQFAAAETDTAKRVASRIDSYLAPFNAAG